MKKLLAILVLLPTLTMASITNWTIKVNKDEFENELKSFSLISTATNGSFSPSKFGIKINCLANKGNIVFIHTGQIKKNSTLRIKVGKFAPASYTHPGNKYASFKKRIELHQNFTNMLLKQMLESEEVKVQVETPLGLETITFAFGEFKVLVKALGRQCPNYKKTHDRQKKIDEANKKK